MELLDWKVYVINGLVAGFILIGLGLGIATNAKTRHGSRAQMALELLLDNIRDLLSGALGEGGEEHLPLVLTLFLYILFCDLLGQVPGFHSATASTSTTIGLGLISFVYIQYQGIKNNGLLGYLKHFLGPVLFLAPLFIFIEIIGEFAKPFSLGMRLFGNIYGEDVMNNLAASAGGKWPIPYQFIVYFLQLFTDLIQAFIFALLTSAYIAVFTSSHHQDNIEIPHENENHGDEIGRIPAAQYGAHH